MNYGCDGAGRTTIMIAHRPSALALADEVVRIPV